MAKMLRSPLVRNTGMFLGLFLACGAMFAYFGAFTLLTMSIGWWAVPADVLGMALFMGGLSTWVDSQ